VLLCAVALIVLGQTGCGREPVYSQETPDDVVASLVEMVRTGQARRIDDLIYADSPQMREVLHHVGELLGQLQGLAAAVHRKFPEDVARLRAEAAEAARTGQVRGLSLAFGAGGGRARGRGERGGDGEERFKEMVAALLADPYGWIETGAERLGTMRLSDDLAAVTLDGTPVFPPVGITLRSDGVKWYIALPTNLPGVAQRMPQTDAEWKIIGSMVKVLRQTVKELTDDVERGNVTGINQLADRAGEKVIWPALMTWVAYQNELDARRRRDRMTRQFDQRHRAWVEAAAASGWEAPRLLSGPVRALASGEIERLSRRNKRPNFERMTDEEFAAFVEGLLKEGGLGVSLSREASPREIGAAVSKWEAERGSTGP